ncbi:Uma2 family endonuclease [Pseudonocardia spinosispora]|uniref:Uma2 family endonuclease n=1 Tax=Pseudonocardia spinosispora TaxID=103441 RepID=UPI000406D242|nr:Uma2 family endonuclease [Pseudonocardia spinosispora]
MATALEHALGPHTVADWRAARHSPGGDRLELLLGHFHSSPPRDEAHQLVIGALFHALWSAVSAASRPDLHVLPSEPVEISTAWRTVLVPDVAVFNAPPQRTTLAARSLLLAAAVWPPASTWHERELKLTGYAGAGIEYLWTVELSPAHRGPHRFRAHRLVHGTYREELTDKTGAQLPRVPAPLPVTLDTRTLYL